MTVKLYILKFNLTEENWKSHNLLPVGWMFKEGFDKIQFINEEGRYFIDADGKLFEHILKRNIRAKVYINSNNQCFL